VSTFQKRQNSFSRQFAPKEIHLLLSRDTVLKGVWHKIFSFLFLAQISFPHGYPIEASSIFYENSRIYSNVKVYNRCQRHWRWTQSYEYVLKIFLKLKIVPIGYLTLMDPGKLIRERNLKLKISYQTSFKQCTTASRQRTCPVHRVNFYVRQIKNHFKSQM
jgi:hypothetical protein